jgi:hypothetical protein
MLSSSWDAMSSCQLYSSSGSDKMPRWYVLVAGVSCARGTARGSSTRHIERASMNSATCESAVRDAPADALCVLSSCAHIQIEMLADIVRASRHMLAREARGGPQAAVHGECMRAGETRSSTAIDQAEEDRTCGDADGLSKLEQGGGGGTGGGLARARRRGAVVGKSRPSAAFPARAAAQPLSPIWLHWWTAVHQAERDQLVVGSRHLFMASHGRQGE